MADQNPVIWFEIPANELDRAKSFYENSLGLELTNSEMGPLEMAWFPMERGATGAAGTLVKAEGYSPSHEGSVVYFNVSEIEGTLERVEQNGGRTLMPKMGIGEHGFIAHFEDSEGNRVALHSES